MSFESEMKIYHFGDLKVIESLDKNIDPLDWVEKNKSKLDKEILTHGGILLRNFNISSVSEFSRFAQFLCPNLLDYTYRSTPRTKLGNKIYTATEYPPHLEIPLHNENSYSLSWPQKIIFFSPLVAANGGETPVANSRKIYQKIDHSIKEKFERHDVLYVRNYHEGVDLSWEEVFQTTDPEEVNQYCEQNNINAFWNREHVPLKTHQICQATLRHPITNEQIWFNQAHLFHISALDQETRAVLIEKFGEKRLPRNAYYGDGSPIEIEALEHIRAIYEQEKIVFKWQKRDIMILDNLLMAHGRQPYQGERKVVVALS
jgi:alpha-ketoglutarate-dependent taurine dioxygenase